LNREEGRRKVTTTAIIIPPSYLLATRCWNNEAEVECRHQKLSSHSVNVISLLLLLLPMRTEKKVVSSDSSVNELFL